MIRSIAAIAVLGSAGVFTARGQWPWRRWQVATPGIVAESFTETVDTLRRGETLGKLFARNGLKAFELPGVPREFSFDLRRLRAGLVFTFRRAARDSVPSRVLVRTGPDHRLSLRRLSEGWNLESLPVQWHPEVLRVEGPIDNSLYEALDDRIDDGTLGGSERQRLAWGVADIFAWQVDFTRDVRPGDRFEVLFEREISEEDDLRLGRVLATRLEVGGWEESAFRFDLSGGKKGYYDSSGLSLRRTFLRAPLEFSRISSRFSGSRYHPILGIWRRHEGTDYAASAGTPVVAAGDGVVLRAEWSAGYGNLIELRHAEGVVTRYGHLQGFARGIVSGARVEQGETIGFVGSTGLTTGPHLHYEFRVAGVARDARAVDLGDGVPVPPSDRPAFEGERDRLQALLEPQAPLLARRTE